MIYKWVHLSISTHVIADENFRVIDRNVQNCIEYKTTFVTGLELKSLYLRSKKRWLDDLYNVPRVVIKQ